MIFFIELFTGLWCLAGMAVYFASDMYIVGHFLLLYAAGYLYVGLLSWHHGVKNT